MSTSIIFISCFFSPIVSFKDFFSGPAVMYAHCSHDCRSSVVSIEILKISELFVQENRRNKWESVCVLFFTFLSWGGHGVTACCQTPLAADWRFCRKGNWKTCIHPITLCMTCVAFTVPRKYKVVNILRTPPAHSVASRCYLKCKECRLV